MAKLAQNWENIKDCRWIRKGKEWVWWLKNKDNNSALFFSCFIKKDLISRQSKAIISSPSQLAVCLIN